MNPTLRWRSSMCAVLLLGAAMPAILSAQFGGTLNLGTGPVAWDQENGRDPLVNGALGASYQTPLLLGLRPELIGEFGLSTGPADGAALRWDLGARLHTTGTTTGAWLGAAIGGAGVRSPSSALTRMEGGVRRALGRAGINLWVSRTTFGSGIAPRGGLGQDTLSPDTLSPNHVAEYTELGSRATLDLNRYEMGLTIMQRLGDASVRRTGWELSATWWVGSTIGLVGAAGRSLPQFGFALPGGRYGTVGLRMAFGAAPRVDRSSLSPREPRSTTGIPKVAITDRRLMITSVPARQAEVMGDFTDWQPRPMVPVGDGRWAWPFDLAAGVHHFNVRFDGGAWLVPAGAVAVDDGFGGRVGLIVVR